MDRHYLTKAGSCLIAAFGFFVSSAAYAQSDIDDPRDREEEASTTIAPSDDWSVTKRSDRCRLARKFGSGEGQVTLRLEKGGVDATFNLTLFGQPVRNPYGQVLSLRFGPGQEAFGRTYISATSSKGRPVIVLYGASYAASVEKEDGGYSVLTPSEAELAQMQYLEIGRAGLRPFKLDFDGSLVSAAKKLDNCTAELETTLRAATTNRAEEAEPVGDRSRWVLPKDYPPMMIYYRKDGLVGFRLTVGRTGKATFCSIRNSTLPQMFDNAVCLALLRNARFTPARDLEGNPVESYYSSGVRFTVRQR